MCGNRHSGRRGTKLNPVVLYVKYNSSEPLTLVIWVICRGGILEQCLQYRPLILVVVVGPIWVRSKIDVDVFGDRGLARRCLNSACTSCGLQEAFRMNELQGWNMGTVSAQWSIDTVKYSFEMNQMIKGMSQMSGILLLSYRVKEMPISYVLHCF